MTPFRTPTISLPLILLALAACPFEAEEVPLFETTFRDCSAPLTVSVEPFNLGLMCPNAVEGTLTGDREFGGSPEITIQVNADIVGNQVVATVHYVAQEPGGDTRIEQTFPPRVLYTPPPGVDIVSIASDASSTIEIVGPKAGEEFGLCNDGEVFGADETSILGSLVRSANLIGDTGAEDVSHDTNCQCDARIENIVFNDLELELRRTGEADCPAEVTDVSPEPLGVFRLRSEPDGEGLERSWLVPDGETVSANPDLLGPLNKTVVQARYSMGPQRTAYLLMADDPSNFSADLLRGVVSDADRENGMVSATFLQLPFFDPSSSFRVDEAEGPFMWVDVDVPSDDWQSFRIYDSGACSALVGWQEALDVPFVGSIPPLIPNIAEALDLQFARCGETELNDTERFSRVAPLEVGVILRSDFGGTASALGKDTDLITISTRYRAPSVGGCAPVNLDVAVGLHLGVDDGAIETTVEFVSAEVEGFCIAEGTIEGELEDAFRNELPAAIAQSFREQLSLSPSMFGLPVSTCSIDDECTGTSILPGKEICVANECRTAIALERVNIRPEGVELVAIEDDRDSLAPFIQFAEGSLCGSERFSGVLLTEVPRSGVFDGSFTVPVGLDASALCGP